MSVVWGEVKKDGERSDLAAETQNAGGALRSSSLRARGHAEAGKSRTDKQTRKKEKNTTGHEREATTKVRKGKAGGFQRPANDRETGFV